MGYSPVKGRFHTRCAPVRRSSAECKHSLLPLDLHVLGLPLAFILSQDQTLHRCLIYNLNIQRTKNRPGPDSHPKIQYQSLKSVPAPLIKTRPSRNGPPKSDAVSPQYVNELLYSPTGKTSKGSNGPNAKAGANIRWFFRLHNTYMFFFELLIHVLCKMFIFRLLCRKIFFLGGGIEPLFELFSWVSFF